ncbi:MAG: hypothetical protein QM758_04465 [Armatimonas sp.]
MYFPDLSMNPWSEISQEYKPGYRYQNIGWLSCEQEFQHGPVEEGIATYIHEQCQNHCINLMCGSHTCDLCYPANYNIFDLAGIDLHKTPILNEEQVKIVNELYLLENGFGNGEIWIWDTDIVYVCPQLITHYIDVHHYKPPDCFLEAVQRIIASLSAS